MSCKKGLIITSCGSATATCYSCAQWEEPLIKTLKDTPFLDHYRQATKDIDHAIYLMEISMERVKSAQAQIAMAGIYVSDEQRDEFETLSARISEQCQAILNKE